MIQYLRFFLPKLLYNHIASTRGIKTYFSKYYKKNVFEISPSWGGVFVVINGCVTHGGLTDRLRGILSVYSLTKKLNVDLHISWSFPFNLEKYLQISEYDWRIPQSGISYNLKYVLPIYIDSVYKRYNIEENKESIYQEHLLRKTIKKVSKYRQVHIYSNAHVNTNEFSLLYKELFKPSPLLKDEIDKSKVLLGDHYHALVFRFRQLLGDFEENDRSAILNINDKEKLLNKCILFLNNYLISNENIKVLVSSDSLSFLKRIRNVSNRIVVFPQAVYHMDVKHINDDNNKFLKSFNDFYLLMGADSICLCITGDMYKSGFAEFAALVGGGEYNEILF